MNAKKSPTGVADPLCIEITACLQEAFTDLESGDPARIARWYPDPYYERTPDITQADADRLIAALDQEYAQEIDGYPEYHKRRSGANAKPDWYRLPGPARLGLAQRLARIADSFE